jgi:hypothetical protein
MALILIQFFSIEGIVEDDILRFMKMIGKFQAGKTVGFHSVHSSF